MVVMNPPSFTAGRPVSKQAKKANSPFRSPLCIPEGFRLRSSATKLSSQNEASSFQTKFRLLEIVVSRLTDSVGYSNRQQMNPLFQGPSYRANLRHIMSCFFPTQGKTVS